MTENERINELLILVEKICEDDFVSLNEIGKLQDWCDENFVDLIGGKFNDVAYALQNFLDNGEFCDDEKCKLLQTIKSLL